MLGLRQVKRNINAESYSETAKKCFDGVGSQFAFACLVLRTCVHHLIDGGFKVLVEVLHHRCPLFVSFCNPVELLLHFRREIVVHDGREVLHEEVVHHYSYVGGQEFTLFVAHSLHFRRVGDELVIKELSNLVKDE